MRRIGSVHVAQPFLEHCMHKYGPRKILLSINGKQFRSKIFQIVRQLLAIAKLFTSTYHPQNNGMIEQYSWVLTAMLHCYVNDHQRDCAPNASTLTYAYNSQLHSFINTNPFDQVLNRRILDFTLISTVFTGKLLITTEQRAGFLVTELIGLCSRFYTAHSRTLQMGFQLAFLQKLQIVKDWNLRVY